MTPSLLALDIALTTGFAAWTPGQAKPEAGLLEIDAGLSLGGRLGSLYKRVLRAIDEWGLTEIIVEEPIVAAAGKPAQQIWRASAYGVVCMAGSQMKVSVFPIENRTWFSHWCGDNKIEKALRKTYSVLEAQRRGFPTITPKQHDIADALGILSLRCCQLALSTPWDSKKSPGPLFTGLPQGIVVTKSNKLAANLLLNRALSFDAAKGE